MLFGNDLVTDSEKDCLRIFIEDDVLQRKVVLIERNYVPISLLRANENSDGENLQIINEVCIYGE